MRREHGFSILEMIVSMGVMLAVTGGIFAVMNPSQGTFQTQTEVSDLQQRLRVASDTLYKDLVMGGGGAYQGSMSGSLNYAFAAIVPPFVRIGFVPAHKPLESRAIFMRCLPIEVFLLHT